MSGEIVVLVSCPSAESEKLACALVEEQLVACVNIINSVRSIYFWHGKLCNETEDLLVIKTNQSVWDGLRDRIKALHSGAVPEIIALSIEGGHQTYLDWINQMVKVR